MDNGATTGPIAGGAKTTEPAFGLPAYWITESQRPQAELHNYTVVEATAVIATHLTELIKSHAHELLTRQAVKNLLDNLKIRVPALIEEVIPTQVKPGELQKVMQNLLRERVPVRDLETILETARRLRLPDQGPGSSQRIRPPRPGPDDLQAIRGRTRPALVPDARSGRGGSDQQPSGAFRPRHDQHAAAADARSRSSSRSSTKSAELTQAGRSAVLLCGPQIRGAVRRMIEASAAASGRAGLQRNRAGGDGRSRRPGWTERMNVRREPSADG